MKFGIGLPPHEPESLVEWARRAEEGPFRTIGILDRVVYHNPSPLIALAAIAGATEQIRLQTEVLLAPLRSTALLAKDIATLDRISGGRFTLGLAVGNWRGPRFDDYRAAGTDFHTRGKRLDAQVAEMRRIWAGEPLFEGMAPIGPLPSQPAGPEILFGGFHPAVLRRVARWKAGFIAAGPPKYVKHLIKELHENWRGAGNPGVPRIVAHCYVALGPQDVVDDALRTVVDYYQYTDDAVRVPEYVAQTPDVVRMLARAYEDLGADEVIFYCWARDRHQVDRLADALQASA